MGIDQVRSALGADDCIRFDNVLTDRTKLTQVFFHGLILAYSKGIVNNLKNRRPYKIAKSDLNYPPCNLQTNFYGSPDFML
jgi:hypothetical protein